MFRIISVVVRTQIREGLGCKTLNILQKLLANARKYSLKYVVELNVFQATFDIIPNISKSVVLFAVNPVKYI